MSSYGLTRPTRGAIVLAETAPGRRPLSDEISIQFTRFSAFYSPLIATIAGGFLKGEGFQPKHSVAPPGKSAIEGLLNGTVHVCQSAPSQGFGPLEKGQAPPAVHFAQINEKDGFFLTGRSPDPAFGWDKLKGKRVLVDHGGQPMAMFKYACFKKGLDFKAIHFEQGSATAAGATSGDLAEASGLAAGTWTATIDLGNGAEAATATFEATAAAP